MHIIFWGVLSGGTKNKSGLLNMLHAQIPQSLSLKAAITNM
jgi:hypothetical protein